VFREEFECHCRRQLRDLRRVVCVNTTTEFQELLYAMVLAKCA
jgi:hypothetical protein